MNIFIVSGYITMGILGGSVETRTYFNTLHCCTELLIRWPCFICYPNIRHLLITVVADIFRSESFSETIDFKFIKIIHLYQSPLSPCTLGVIRVQYAPEMKFFPCRPIVLFYNNDFFHHAFTLKPKPSQSYFQFT